MAAKKQTKPAKAKSAPAAKIKKRKPRKTARSTGSRPLAKKWTDEYKAVGHLLEKELQGLIQYLRAIHYTAIVLILAISAALVSALRMVYLTDQQAIVGSLAFMVAAILSLILAAWVLRPWVLPRFLLPIDLAELNIKQLTDLFKDPEKYLNLLKNHIQVLTEEFLIVKLKRLRNATIVLLFGIAIAIVLSIALP